MLAAAWFGLVVLAAADAGAGGGQRPYSYQYFRRQIGPVFDDDEANRWVCVVFGLCAIVPSTFSQKSELGIVYQWSQLEFDYATPADRQIDVDSGFFRPGAPTPIDTDVHYSFNSRKKNRVFVTVPRFQEGIPVTLGVVTDRNLNNNPIIAPYPAWSWHRNPESCPHDRIVSVFRVFIDECQRLWVLDTGRLLEKQTCPPQILAFDLQTDQLIHRYEIPEDQIESRSVLVTPVVDIRDAHDKCRDTYVYVADCQTYSIIVYDVQKDISWKVTDKTMYPYPNYGTYNILGDSFDLMDGILGMALSPYRPGEDRKLFFHAMSSPTENWVFTSELRNRTRYIHDAESSPEIFHTYRGERRTQSAAEAMDKDGVMYFGLMSDVTLNCWNTRGEYGVKNFDAISRNRERMQFASGVKVATNSHAAEELWVMTSRFQKVMAETLSTSEVNFRIQAGKIEELTKGTACKGGRSRPGGGGYGLVKPHSGSYTSSTPAKAHNR